MKNPLVVVLTAALVAACGGDLTAVEDPLAPLATPMASNASSESAPQRAVRADPGARARAIRFVTHEQVEQLDDRVGGGWVPVMVERCCHEQAVELAVLLAWGVQAAAKLPADAPFFVYGDNPDLVRATAERLADGGAEKVWVIAP